MLFTDSVTIGGLTRDRSPESQVRSFIGVSIWDSALNGTTSTGSLNMGNLITETQRLMIIKDLEQAGYTITYPSALHINISWQL